MKFYVNENCISCGMCTSICPNVFDLGDEGIAKAIDDDVMESDMDEALSAMAGCPVNAIEEI